MVWSLLFDGCVLLVLWFSAVMDMRKRVVYEPLILLTLLLSLVVHFSLARILITGLVFGVAYLFVLTKRFGLGDAEILALIAAAFGGETTIFIAGIGVLLAMLYALVKMTLGKTRRATFAMVPFLTMGASICFVGAIGFSWFL